MIGVAWGLISMVEAQRGQCVHVVFRGGGVTVGKRIPEVRHPGVAEIIHCGVCVTMIAVETGFDRLLAEHAEGKKQNSSSELDE